MKAYFVKFVKIITIVLMLTYLIFPHYSKALSLSEIIAGGEQFLQKGESNQDELFNADKEQEAVDQIYYILLGIAIIAAFVVGAVLGIQFITSGAAGQAKVKEKLIPFVVGLFVVFGAFGIWKIALNLGRTLLEAPPASLVSNDTIDITIAPVGNSSNSRTHTYELEEEGLDASVESAEIQDLGIYFTNAEDNINLPIAEITINISVSDKNNMIINPSSVEGCNGYNATFDEENNTIKITYGDTNNVPSVYGGEAICQFEITYTDVIDYDYDRIYAFKENFDLYDKTYTTTITSIECYDKYGNNITDNINIEKDYQLKIKYKYHIDSVYTDVGDQIVDGLYNLLGG